MIIFVIVTVPIWFLLLLVHVNGQRDLQDTMSMGSSFGHFHEIKDIALNIRVYLAHLVLVVIQAAETVPSNSITVEQRIYCYQGIPVIIPRTGDRIKLA